jgi:hypothetical protein
MNDSRLALFVLLGRTAENKVGALPDNVPRNSLAISNETDLSFLLPAEVKSAELTAFTYKLFFVFENYLRDFVVEVLSENDPDWWENKVSAQVKDEVTRFSETEDTKMWMAFKPREKIFLTTYPQLFLIIEENWKRGFSKIIRDKNLIQEARMISHIRNTACHMVEVPEEEVERVKLVVRDWLRMVQP